jgi:hypothetical protein
MSTLYITEYQGLGPRGSISSMAHDPPNVEQTVTISASHAESNALNPSTNVIRLHTDVVCSVAIGTAPVATATSRRMAANQTEYFAVHPISGTPLKVSVITNS